MNTYDLSRAVFNYSFENPEKVKSGHIAIYFFAVDSWNRCGWKEKFSFPSGNAMEAVGIRKYQTYIAYLNDLVEWGFIQMVQRSKNQHTANIISINTAMPKNGKALDKATALCYAKKRQSKGQSKGQSKDSIHKPITNNQEIGHAAEPPLSLSDLEKREKAFYELLVDFITSYPKEMIRAFYDYWREPNKSKSKMRWEIEKTWDLNLRLKKWANNERPDFKNKKLNDTNPDNSEARRKAEERTAQLASER